MSPFCCAIFLLGISSLATAVNLTLICQWSDYEWQSEASRTQALEDGTYKPAKIFPRYMAVYGTRIFLSLEKLVRIPVTLVSVPRNSASSAPPKLTPFPSWDMHLHGKGDCNKIEVPRKLEVDSVGRMWILDDGSDECNSKIWTIDLINKDRTKLIHRFSQKYELHDIVLDETKNDTLAYVSRWFCRYLFVFNLERNESWIVVFPRINVFSLALSPKDQDPRQLYVSNRDDPGVYFILVAVLRNRTGNAHPELIGNWTARPSKMQMDIHGTIFAAFYSMNYISSWKTSQPFEEQRFHEVSGHEDQSFFFTIELNGTFWITVTDRNGGKSNYRILKEQSFEASPVPPVIPTTTKEQSSLSVSTAKSSTSATTEVQECIILKEKLHQYWCFNMFLFCSYVFTVIFLTFIILRQNRKIISLSQNTNEVHEMEIYRDKPNKDHDHFPDDVYSRPFSPDLEAAEKSQYATDGESESDYFEQVVEFS